MVRVDPISGRERINPMPLKMAGSEIRTIFAFIVAINTPSVVLESAIHPAGNKIWAKCCTI
jgi:hypothetical protein